MRTALGVALLTVCLGLAGCSLFGKKQAAHKNNPKPFLGSEAPAKTETAVLPRDKNGHLPNANGSLAGRVVVEATDQPIKASILIKNLQQEEAKGADLDFWTDESGYFLIPKLNPGETYLLTVRANDHGDLISRTVWAQPPNPTLFVRLDRRFTTASTPPPPDMPRLREKQSTAGAESTPEKKPRVNIEAPIQLPGPQSGAASGSRQSDVPARDNPANIADGGFHRIMQPPSQTISIPPPPPPSSQPQWDSMPEQRQPGRAVPSNPAGSVGIPNIPTPVPSCLLLGNRLENFALYDLDGNVWEYKRDRRGRLLLLDFWRTNCPACLYAIPHLVELQRDFGTYGLEVIGIAQETGSVEEQRRNLRPMLNRKGVNYKNLLSGGGAKDYYPVMGDFQVTRVPRLVLIDADGTIIWRSPADGMDIYAHNDLRKLIRDRLVARQAQP